MNVFSIVIPVHNKEEYLKKTLDCVLGQTYTHFELILVNDGSVDLSGDICDEYASIDSRIKVLHQKNGGVSNARNTGVKAAKNELISFLDADDLWRPNFLYEMNRMIEHYPNVDIYSSKFATIQNGIVIENEKFFSSIDKFILFDLIESFAEKVRFPLHTSSVIIKKNAVENVGYFDERIIVFEDFDLFVRIALHSKVAYLNSKPLSFYNLDVPANTKARGVVPDINKHWLSFFEKFETQSSQNEKLKLLLDRAILTQLISYYKLPSKRKTVKLFLKKVDKKNFSIKYKLIYFTPPFIGLNILKLYQYIIKITRSKS